MTSTTSAAVTSAQPSSLPVSSQTSSAAWEPLPRTIAGCSATEQKLGTWVPTLDDLLAVAGELSCVDKKSRVAAVRACASRVGATTIKVEIQERENKSCEVQFIPASWADRRWIVITGTYVTNGTVDGDTNTMEIVQGKAKPYLTQVDECKPRNRADFEGLPKQVQQFLCRPR